MRTTSQSEALGLTRKASSNAEQITDALEATEKALSRMKLSLEHKRAVVQLSSNLARRTSGFMAESSEQLSSRTEEGDASDEEVVFESRQMSRTSKEDSEDVDDLREAIAASDLQVTERLSQFCPADVRSELRATAKEEAASSRHSSVQTSSRHSARSPHSPGGRLKSVCLELIETEQKYLRDLSLLVHTFVQGLRRLAPDLIQPLVANAEQLLQLHTALAERLAAAAITHRTGTALAEALGSELLSVSPYLLLYVEYCGNFMSGDQMLAKGVKADKRLAKLVEATEAQITRRNIVERGVTMHVSIHAFLIKPVQRLCQYPLLYREVLKALPKEDHHPSPQHPIGGGAGGRLRPKGGAAAPAPTSASGRGKASYVLAVLEEVAQDVNDKVKQQEERSNVVQKLMAHGHSNPQTVVSAVLGPAAALQLEIRVELLLLDLKDAHSMSEKLAAWARTLSFQKVGAKGKSGKLFIFRDRLLLARPASGGESFLMLACWPLDETTAMLGPYLRGGKAGEGRVLVLSRADERVECGCAPAEAERALHTINEMHDALLDMRKRHAKRRSLHPGK